MQKKRGLFIVFEGLDRAGKSTQAKLLQKYFNLHEEESKLLIFPGK
jgi:thymidylate kinase